MLKPPTTSIQYINSSSPTHKVTQSIIPTQSIVQSHPITANTIQSTLISPVKDTILLKENEMGELVRSQANKLAHLEDRLNVVAKEYKRLNEDHQYKLQEIQQWNQDYKSLEIKYNNAQGRIDQLEQQITDLKGEIQRYMQACDQREQQIIQYDQIVKEKQQDLQFYKQRSNDYDTALQKVVELQNRIKVLELENERLNANNNIIPPTYTKQQIVYQPTIESQQVYQSCIQPTKALIPVSSQIIQPISTYIPPPTQVLTQTRQIYPTTQVKYL